MQRGPAIIPSAETFKGLDKGREWVGDSTIRVWSSPSFARTMINRGLWSIEVHFELKPKPNLLSLQSAIKHFVSHAVNSLSQNAHAREHKYMQDFGCNIKRVDMSRWFQNWCTPNHLPFSAACPLSALFAVNDVDGRLWRNNALQPMMPRRGVLVTSNC